MKKKKKKDESEYSQPLHCQEPESDYIRLLREKWDRDAAEKSLYLRMLRQLLKQPYPRMRFSVSVGPTAEPGLQGVSVSWTNGPTERRVAKLLAPVTNKKSLFVFRRVKPTHLRLVD